MWILAVLMQSNSRDFAGGVFRKFELCVHYFQEEEIGTFGKNRELGLGA